MSEENIVSSQKAKSPVWTIVYVVVVSAIVFGALGYWLGGKSDKTETQETATATVNATKTVAPSVTTSASGFNGNDVTADWKTYTSSDYGFSFRYPSGWGIREGASRPYVVSLDAKNFAPQDATSTDLTIDVKYYDSISDYAIGCSEITKDSTIDELISKLPIGNHGNCGIGLEKLGVKTIDGREFIAAHSSQNVEGDIYNLFYIKDGHFYDIEAGGYKYWPTSDLREDVLSTFQFTK